MEIYSTEIYTKKILGNFSKEEMGPLQYDNQEKKQNKTPKSELFFLQSGMSDMNGSHL